MRLMTDVLAILNLKLQMASPKNMARRQVRPSSGHKLTLLRISMRSKYVLNSLLIGKQQIGKNFASNSWIKTVVYCRKST
jgi:hypothetical protein